MKNLTEKQAEKLEITLNASLKSLYYKSSELSDDKNENESLNIVLEKLIDLGFNVNTSRRGEHILKLQDSWVNGGRIHIYIHCIKFYKEDIENENFVNVISVHNRKSLLKKYREIGKELNLENDEFLKAWYVSVVRWKKVG